MKIMQTFSSMRNLSLISGSAISKIYFIENTGHKGSCEKELTFY